MVEKYQGIFAANTTPFKEDGRLDETALAAEIDYLINQGIKGFFAGGTYGEGPMMSVAEYGDYIKAYMTATAGRVPVIAQIGATSLETAVQQGKLAEKAGADSVAAIFPFYFPHDELALYEYFKDLAGAVDLPLFVYNNPWRSGNSMSPTLLGKLSQISGVIGIKDSCDSIQEFCKYKMQVPADFKMMIGNDDMTLSGLTMGANGGIIVLAALFPDIYVNMYQAFMAGDSVRARELQYEAIRVRLVLKKGPYISTYKAVMNLLGRHGGLSKKPTRMPTTEEMAAIEKGLRALGRL